MLVVKISIVALSGFQAGVDSWVVELGWVGTGRELGASGSLLTGGIIPKKVAIGSKGLLGLGSRPRCAETEHLWLAGPRYATRYQLDGIGESTTRNAASTIGLNRACPCVHTELGTDGRRQLVVLPLACHEGMGAAPSHMYFEAVVSFSSGRACWSPFHSSSGR